MTTKPSEQLAEIERLVQDGFETADFLVTVACEECGHEHFFEPDNPPGGDGYCEECGARLDGAGETTR